MEIRINEIPIPLKNYVNLLKNKKSPYYDIIRILLKEMEFHYLKTGQSEIVYAINPRMLHEEIELIMKNNKLTTITICRTILAFLYSSGLKEGEEFYASTTSGGRKNYHIKINQTTLNTLRLIL